MAHSLKIWYSTLVEFPQKGDDDHGALDIGAALEVDCDLPPQIHVHDIIHELKCRLSPPEEAVLDLLAEGYGIREIGRLLNVSHVTVLERRSKLAALAQEFGIGPRCE